MISATETRKSEAVGEVILEARDLKTHFPVTGGVFHKVMAHIKAVNGVDITLHSGEIVSVVGESGCGKSTLGYSLLGLVPPTSGTLKLMGREIDIHKPSSWKTYRRDFQIIFQDPYTSLNPRHTIFEILAEPMFVHRICTRAEAREKVASLLERVGLQPEDMHKFPHAFSGGQRQRLGIARAISLKPKVIICDEVVASLDVSVQAQIIQLLLDLKQDLGLSLLFISHDLSLVRNISDSVHVMYLGRIMESATADDLFHAPRHPYTRALLDSIPTLDRKKRPKLLLGEVPSPVNLPQGCPFQSRCPHVQDRCRDIVPELEIVGNSRAACYFPLQG